MASYYDVLGVTKTATQAEIRKAYLRLSMAHHPDKHVNASEDEKKMNREKFDQINEANQVLSDPAQRADYDRAQANGADNAAFQQQQANAANQAREAEVRHEQEQAAQQRAEAHAGAQRPRAEHQGARHSRAEHQGAARSRAEAQDEQPRQKQYQPTRRFFVHVQPPQQPALSLQGSLGLTFLLDSAEQFKRQQVVAQQAQALVLLMYFIMLQNISESCLNAAVNTQNNDSGAIQSYRAPGVR